MYEENIFDKYWNNKHLILFRMVLMKLYGIRIFALCRISSREVEVFLKDWSMRFVKLFFSWNDSSWSYYWFSRAILILYRFFTELFNFYVTPGVRGTGESFFFCLHFFQSSSHCFWLESNNLSKNCLNLLFIVQIHLIDEKPSDRTEFVLVLNTLCLNVNRLKVNVSYTNCWEYYICECLKQKKKYYTNSILS